MSRFLTYGILNQPRPYRIFLGSDFNQVLGFFNYIIRLNSDSTQDPSFLTGTGFNDDVRAIAIQSDGKILVGGDFTSYNGTTQNRMVRLNTDGSIDTGFDIGDGFNNDVFAITIQSDGKILVGGDFTSYDGSSQTRMIRLNTDGSKDTGFDVGNGFNDIVQTIKIQSDGKIVVGGTFTFYDGTSYNRIVRLNTDASYDTGFSSGTGFNNRVITIAIQSDGKILAGGFFTSYDGTGYNRIARLNTDGSDDTGFSIGTGANSNVNAIEIQSDGKIIVGGAFTSYDGTSYNRMVRLNTDGSDDTNFDIGNGFNNQVFDVKIQSDGKIVAGGFFFTFPDGDGKRIARLNTDGSRDTSFLPGDGFNDQVNTIAIQSDGKIMVGGDFTTYAEYQVGEFGKFKLNGDLVTSFDTGDGFDDAPSTIAVQEDGKILVGGFFDNYDGSTQGKIIRFNPDASKDTSFSIGTGFNSTVFDIKIQSDGKILAGGRFTSYNGTSQSWLIRLDDDGSIDTGFSTGTGFSGGFIIVRSIAIQSDGKILIGGEWTGYDGTSINNLARLNTDGSLDTGFSVGTGFNGRVLVIAIQSDGKILVGGQFTSYNGTTQNRITRLNTDGSRDTGFSIGTGFNNQVNDMKIQSDGKIVVVGQFTSYDGTTQNRITRLNTDGSRDTGFSIGTGLNNVAFGCEVLHDGSILVGGLDIGSYNGDTQRRIVKINSDGTSTAYSFGAGIGPRDTFQTVFPILETNK